MKFTETGLSGVILVEPRVHRDDRGFFLETWHRDRYREGGIDAAFVQDNHSRSVRNTLRGLHAQQPNPQGKLVRCVEGEVWDVAVDIRRGSSTFKQWVGVVLSEESFRQLWIPPGFAHGFCVLSDTAQIEYKCTAFYSRDDELSIAWDDPELDIAWPLEAAPLLSAKDRDAPSLRDAWDRLPADDG